MHKFLIFFFIVASFAIFQAKSMDVQHKEISNIKNDESNKDDANEYVLEEEEEENNADDNNNEEDDGDEMEYYYILVDEEDIEDNKAENNEEEADDEAEEDLSLNSLGSNIMQALQYLLSNADELDENTEVEIVNDPQYYLEDKEEEEPIYEPLEDEESAEQFCLESICPRMYVPICVLRDGVKMTMPSPCVYSNKVKCDRIKQQRLGRAEPTYQVLGGGTCDEYIEIKGSLQPKPQRSYLNLIRNKRIAEP